MSNCQFDISILKFIFSHKLIPSPLIPNSAYSIIFYLFLQYLKKSSLSYGLVISTSEIFLKSLLLTFPSPKPLRSLLSLILITTTITRSLRQTSFHLCPFSPLLQRYPEKSKSSSSYCSTSKSLFDPQCPKK